MQCADEAENRVRNALHIVRERLRLCGLHEALKICTVRDHIRLRLHGAQAVSQRVSGGKDVIRFFRKLQLHRVDERRIHQSAVGRMPVNAVVDQRLMRDQIDKIGCDGRIDPQNSVFKAVLPHLCADKPCDFLLVQLVDPPEFIKEWQNWRQRINRDILLRVNAILFIIRQPRLSGFVLHGGDIGDRRVKIENFCVRDAAHDLLLARRDGVPRGGGKANDFSHMVSSSSLRAASSFSAARRRRRSVEYGCAVCMASSIRAHRLSFVTSSSSMQCFWPR